MFALDECNPDSFNSEIVMECMKRTNDLHTTQQCLMLLSKGAQLFPVRFLASLRHRKDNDTRKYVS
jgi:hypothetical protein